MVPNATNRAKALTSGRPGLLTNQWHDKHSVVLVWFRMISMELGLVVGKGVVVELVVVEVVVSAVVVVAVVVAAVVVAAVVVVDAAVVVVVVVVDGQGAH